MDYIFSFLIESLISLSALNIYIDRWTLMRARVFINLIVTTEEEHRGS